jgi:two-component system, OmpR family, response regulator
MQKRADQAVPCPDLPPDAHVLVVEDDGDMRVLLIPILTENGLLAGHRGARRPSDVRNHRATAGQPGSARCHASGHHGLDLCRALRARSDVAIIMVTACGPETDRVLGLEFSVPMTTSPNPSAALSFW